MGTKEWGTYDENVEEEREEFRGGMMYDINGNRARWNICLD